MTDRVWHKAWLGIGGNLGDVGANMQTSIELLAQHEHIEVLSASSVYKTPPWGKLDQPWFYNAALELSTCLEPEALLEICLETERDLNRVRQERWGPRTIDLDILAVEQGAVLSQRLTVPHPRLTERAFALVPLAELAPDLMLEGKTVLEWSNLVDADGIEKTDLILAT